MSSPRIVQSLAVSMLLVIAGCGGRTDNIPDRFEVSGPSMAPTLVGRHIVVTCADCETQFRVPVELRKPDGESFPCWHCGTPMTQTAGSAKPGDVIRIAPIDDVHQPLQRGDVVAIRRGGFMRVKRLVGLPGDVIDFNAGQLTVNGKVFHCETRLPVDQDTLRKESRWTGHEFLHRDRDRSWRLIRPRSTNQPFAWLTYGHRSVYAANLSAPIRDDYPGNVNLRRELQPAHDLVLTMNVGPKTENAAIGGIDVLFWTPTGIRIQTKSVPDEFTALEFSSAKAQAGKDLSVPESLSGIVSEASPVSIRIGMDAIVSGILLEREIAYRLNPDHDPSAYPLTLDQDQVFVLGDNVPVSIDSRDWGPLKVASVVGRMPLAP